MNVFKMGLGLFVLGFVSDAMAQSGNGAVDEAVGTVLVLAFIFGAIIMYFVPTVIAHLRKASNLDTVVLLNIFLGWTAIGWFVALILACSGKPRDQTQRYR